jgi:DNA-binding transcriptional regulator/RsmH inhibitor MraZ
MAEQGLFVTSLDAKVGAIYPSGIWKLNKAMMLRSGLDRQRNGVWDNSQIYGEDMELDAEGRVLLPTIMRRDLGFEDRPVRVYCNRGRIEILSEAVYEERRRKAAETAEADLAALENAGFL